MGQLHVFEDLVLFLDPDGADIHCMLSLPYPPEILIPSVIERQGYRRDHAEYAKVVDWPPL